MHPACTFLVLETCACSICQAANRPSWPVMWAAQYCSAQQGLSAPQVPALLWHPVQQAAWQPPDRSPAMSVCWVSCLWCAVRAAQACRVSAGAVQTLPRTASPAPVCRCCTPFCPGRTRSRTAWGGAAGASWACLLPCWTCSMWSPWCSSTWCVALAAPDNVQLHRDLRACRVQMLQTCWTYCTRTPWCSSSSYICSCVCCARCAGLCWHMPAHQCLVLPRLKGQQCRLVQVKPCHLLWSADTRT